MATVGVVKAIVTADVAQLKKGMNEAQPDSYTHLTLPTICRV